MYPQNRWCSLVLSTLLITGCGSSGGGGVDPIDGFTVVEPGGDTDALAGTDGDTSPLLDVAGPTGGDVPPSQDTDGVVDAALAADVEALDASPSQDAPVDGQDSAFVGRWALRYSVTSLTEVPVLGGVMATEILSLQIVEIAPTDAGIDLTVETCSVEMISEEGALSETVLPDAFVDSIPVVTRSAVLTDDGAGFYAEPLYEVRGAILDNPIEDPLPTQADDPQVFDQDEDGHPGMTISVTGFVDGDIYLVQRGWNALTTTSFDGARAFGSADWGDEQNYLGASSLVLEQIQPSSWPDPDTSKHGFELVYAPEITCVQVMGTTAAIFESH